MGMFIPPVSRSTANASAPSVNGSMRKIAQKVEEFNPVDKMGAFLAYQEALEFASEEPIVTELHEGGIFAANLQALAEKVSNFVGG